MRFLQKSEDNNPWGKKSNGNNKPKNHNGPPDLEEAIRRFLGGKKRNNSSGGSGGGKIDIKLPGGKLFISLVIIVIIAIWVLSGIFIVQPAEQGVVLRFGKYVSTVEPGMHWYPRFVEKVYIENVDALNTASIHQEMLTSEENIVQVSFTVQYHIGDLQSYLFNVTDPKLVLAQALESSVRQTIGQNKLEKILTTNRTQISDNVRSELVGLLKEYKTGIAVNEIIMQPARPPEAVKSSFDDVIKAREDKEKMANLAQAYTNKIVPIAKGKAQRVLDEAGAYREKVVLQAQANVAKFDALLPEYKKAPEIIKNQMYFNAMQSVLQDSKVFLVEGDGNNNLFYWPNSTDSERTFAKIASGNGFSNSSDKKTLSKSTKNSMTRQEYMRWLEANQ